MESATQRTSQSLMVLMCRVALVTMEGGDTSVTNQIKRMAQRSELYVLRRAHGIYFNLVPHLRLWSIEALYLAGEGNSRIDVNVV